MNQDQKLRRIVQDLSSDTQTAHRALGQLHDLYARRFMGALRTRGFTMEDAEEIVQDVFIRILEKPDGIAAAESQHAYIFRILINRAIDSLRRASPQYVEIGQVEHALYSEDDNDDGSWDCLVKALLQFQRDEPERALVYQAAVIEGFTGNELAELLGRTPQASRQYLCESRKRFRSLLRLLCPDYLAAKTDTH